MSYNILIQRMAAEVLAATVLELFPGVVLLEGGDFSLGFYYDFFSPFPFQEHHLVLVEEKMRGLVKKNVQFKTLEMVPDNAGSFLEHLGQHVRAEEARMIEDSLSVLIQIGEFVDLCPLPHGKSSGETGAFSLQKFQHLQDGQVRITGIACENVKDLKKIIKNLHRYEKENHITLGKRLNLFDWSAEEGWIWLPKGEAFKDKLRDLWKREREAEGFLCISRLFTQHMPLSLLEKNHRVAEWVCVQNSDLPSRQEGLFEPAVYLAEKAYTLCSHKELEQECISSLQFMTKISKILDFEARFVVPGRQTLKGKERGTRRKVVLQALDKGGFSYIEDSALSLVEMRVADRLDREWTIGTLDVVLHPQGGQEILITSSFWSLERVVALVLELEKEVRI